jgi:hypothetical protein
VVVKLDGLIKAKKWVFPSFRREPESSYFKLFWTPAFAGVTIQETFYEIVEIEKENSASRNNPLAGA